MDLTAQHVLQKQFHDAWRGYNQEEVDDFLDRIAETLTRLERENSALHGRLRELDQMVEASRGTEEMLKKTLMTAQKAAEEAIATARTKAENLVGEAEERARRANDELKTRVATAEDEVRRKAAEVEREQEVRKREIQASVDRLEGFETEIKRRLKSFLDQQLKALDTLVEKDLAPRVHATPHQGQTQTPGERLHASPSQRVQGSVEMPSSASPEPMPEAPEAQSEATDGLEEGPDAEGEFKVMEDQVDFEDYVREGSAEARRRPLRTLFRRNDREGEDWAEESTR
jgi:cell division initiation protein